MNIIEFDYNWFFSAFSQSGAAIIAIIGGFVISKLIDSENKLDICLEEFNMLEINYRDLFNKIRLIDFSKYYYNLFWSSPLIWSFIKNDQLKNKNDTEILNHLYGHCSELFKSDKLILDKIKSIINTPSVLLDSYPKSGEGLEKWNKKLENLKIKGELSEATRKTIQDYKFKSENLISQFTLNKTKLNTLSKGFIGLRRTIYLLYVSLLCFVIYPLHFLPISKNNNSFYTFDIKYIFSNMLTFKNFLLFAFFIIIGIIFLIFVIKTCKSNKRIKGLKDSLFDKYMNISNYSEHFKAISISGK